MTRATNATNGFTVFYAMDGDSYTGNELKRYKKNLGELIKNEQYKINKLIKQVDEINKF
jgi:hypothetical protein